MIVGSMSKAYRMIGWRVGWIAGPGRDRQRRRLGAHLQHDRRPSRSPAARPRPCCAGRRSTWRRRRPSSSAAATRSSPRCPGWPLVRPAGGWSLLRRRRGAGRRRPRRRRRRCSRRASRRRGMDGWGGGGRGALRALRVQRRAGRAAGDARRAAREDRLVASLEPHVRDHHAGAAARRAPRAARAARARTRQLGEPLGASWRRGSAASGELLDEGADAARRAARASSRRAIGDEHDLHGQPAAQAVGARLAGARGVSDLLLERNQAFRSALLDLQHVTTLLGYTAALARTRGDAALAAWHDGWARALRRARGARAGRRGGDGGRSGGRDRARRRGPRWAARARAWAPPSAPSARRSTHSPLGRLARRRAT